jgi:uncharacterized protein (DUF1330 family)
MLTSKPSAQKIVAMAAYVIASYTVTNEEGYATYISAVGPTLRAHGAEILVAGSSGDVREGDPGEHTVVLRFPSKEAAQGWYDSKEYQDVVHLRTDNSRGTLVICDEFVRPN